MKKIFLTLGLMALTSACTSNPLNNTTYVLDNNNQLPITLTLDENGHKFYGKAVNNYFGTFSINNDQITFNQQGATMMMAPPHEMTQEDIYFKNLKSVQNYKIENNQLILTLKNNQELIFNKK